VGDEPRFDLTFSVTPEDALEATLGRLEVSDALRRQVNIVRVLGVVLLLVGLIPVAMALLVTALDGSMDSTAAELTFFGFVAVALGLFYILRARPMALGRTRKVNAQIFQQRWTAANSLPIRLVASAEGVATTSAVSRTSIVWAAVSEVQRSDLFLVLWLGPNGIVVPRRAFPSQEEFDRFAQWAEYWRAQAPALI
jgi:YcxB-like protein